MSYKFKYLKYKNKYQHLKIKNQIGGGYDPSLNLSDIEPLTQNEYRDINPDHLFPIGHHYFEINSLFEWISREHTNPMNRRELSQKVIQCIIKQYCFLFPNNTICDDPTLLTREKLQILFTDLQNVTEIYLPKRGYTRIALDTFIDLPALQILDLQHNKLIGLEPGVFNDLTALRDLSLNNNELTQLQHGIFDNLPVLETLDLGNNQLIFLEPGVFNDLPVLEDLWLGNNQLIQLEPGVFNNLPELETLDLGSNQLTFLELGVFNDLPVLKDLWLGNNQLTLLEPGVFNNLPELQILDLEYNTFTDIQPSVFNNLPLLQTLYLNSSVTNIDSLKSTFPYIVDINRD